MRRCGVGRVKTLLCLAVAKRVEQPGLHVSDLRVYNGPKWARRLSPLLKQGGTWFSIVMVCMGMRFLSCRQSLGDRGFQ